MNMNRIIPRRPLATLALAATATLPLGTAAAAAHASTRTSTTSLPATFTSRTFKGSVQQMQQWGPVQVSIVVSNKKITKVNVSAAAHTGRSIEIQDNAIPILKSETLQAQSAAIDVVSRATDTSGAYIASLASAVKSARAAKALK